MAPDRSIAPAIAPLAVPALLPYSQTSLPNGIEVVYIHDPAQEVFKIDIQFEAGIYYQPQPLLSSATVNMLNEGTTRHDAEAIAEIFDYYGAYIDYNCGLNKVELSLISLNKYAAETIAMLAEMIADSVIPEKELEIFLRNKRQEFLVGLEKTSYLARKEFSKLLFGEQHPYANIISEKDYSRVSASSVRDFYHRHINARNCRIMICGNVSQEVLSLLETHFSGLQAPATPLSTASHTFSPAPAGRYKVVKDKAVQASLRIGKKGVRITETDYAGFQLLNTVLGGYFGSRLMSNIREEKGYTYGIQSFNVSMPEGSYWCIATDVNSDFAEAAIDETLKEIGKLQTELIPEDELTLVKNYFHGDLLREIDGVFSQMDALKHKLNYGLTNEIYLSIIDKIKTCRAEDLLELANKYWNPDDMYIVTAGK